jgi:Tol biopolymer transport system component
LAALAILLLLLNVFAIGAPTPVIADGTGYGRQVMVANEDGSDSHTVTSVGNNFSPSWSPDGAKIVMTSDRDGGWDIYVHDLATGRDTRITSTHDGSNADWNPKNAEVVFSYNFGILGKRNSDGTGAIKNLPGLPNIFFTQPQYSPNGKLIASYGETVNGGPRLIFVQNADGSGKPVPLAGQEGDKNWQPAWQSDTIISYVSMRRDGTYLVSYNLESKQTSVGRKVNGLGELSWDQESGLAYSWYDTQRTLVSIEKGTNQPRIFAVGNEPDWSADGTRLAYVNGTYPGQSGWICPISFNGMISVTIEGTNPVSPTVEIFGSMDSLSIRPSGQSNLEGREYSWDNPGPGKYSGSWAVTNILSPTIEFTVHNVWNGFPMEDWYMCMRVQYHISFRGNIDVDAVRLQGPDIDETIQMNQGSALRPWLRDGIYLATPIIDGVEQVGMRQSVNLIGHDAVVSWETQEEPAIESSPDTHAGSNAVFLPLVVFPVTQ